MNVVSWRKSLSNVSTSTKYLNLKFSIEEDTEWSTIVIMFGIEKSEVKSRI